MTDTIDPFDITQGITFDEPRWFHCHPDKVDEVMKIAGWSADEVIIEYIEADDGEHYYCSIRRIT